MGDAEWIKARLKQILHIDTTKTVTGGQSVPELERKIKALIADIEKHLNDGAKD